jgi:ABC-type nitrate/sulfonate/bicarbonate transport system permease component
VPSADAELASGAAPPAAGVAPSGPLTASLTPAPRARWRPLARRVGGVLIAIGIWELVSVSGVVTDQALASVTATASAMAAHAGALASAAGGTLKAWALGVAIAAILGVGLGTLVGRSQIAEALTEVLVRMMRPLPSLALIPVAILIAGLGLTMTTGLVAFTSFWPIFINTRYGVRQVDNLFIDTGHTLGLRGARLVARVILPAAAPLIAGGIQVAISLALVVTVSVELVGGTGGLGTLVLQAQQGNAVSTMYAGIIVGGLVGWALNVGYAALVRRALPWSDRRVLA